MKSSRSMSGKNQEADRIKRHTSDLAKENYDKLKALFSEAITETIDEDGDVVRAVDADMLQQLISATVVQGPKERYQFTWPDKKKAIVLGNTPTTKTLRLDREKSVGRDGTPGSIDTENIYIEGDNLDALKLLRETYLGKVKMIYIDPPYNTGNDFVYKDDFVQSVDKFRMASGEIDERGNRLVENSASNGRFHTDWLNMLYPRISIARSLLAPDGVMVISIGHQELANLVVMCREFFGDHQIVPVTIQTSGGKPSKGFNISNEYLVFVVPEGFSSVPIDAERSGYSSPYHGMTLATFDQTERPNQAYPIYVDEEGRIVGCGLTLQEQVDSGRYTGPLRDFAFDCNETPEGCVAVWPVTKKGKKCVWRLIPARLLENWHKGYIKVVPVTSDGHSEFAIQYLSGGIIERIENGELQTYRVSDRPDIPTVEIKDFRTAGATIPTVWTDNKYYTAQGNKDIESLFGGVRVFPYPKPKALVHSLLARILEDDGSIVLDFFSGSATTAEAAMLLNAANKGAHRFILVQLPEVCQKDSEAEKCGFQTVCEIGEERIRRAGKKIRDDTSADIDYGFRVFRVDSGNLKDVYLTPGETQQMDMEMHVDNIKEGRTSEDLLFQTMLGLGIPLSATIEESEIDGKKVYAVADSYLLACFDPEVSESTVEAIAKRHPFYAVFRDCSMRNDSVAMNFEQIFDTYSPDTTRKVL